MTISIVCDQAIFSSSRGPTGEGYRIVGASKGVRPDDRQKITRCSPSHGSLCAGDDDSSATTPMGAAFYGVSGNRLCVALSRHAGAEHTGRGGKCVHTHNVIFSADDFARCAFNPFAIVRALSKIDPISQKLPPGGAIPQLELSVEIEKVGGFDASCTAQFPSGARLAALNFLLDKQAQVVEVADAWLPWAEALILGLPGPLRAQVSFAAGLRFSTGRSHLLQLLHDDKKAVQTRAEAQGLKYVGAESKPARTNSKWFAFVESHWARRDLRGLARRTSRPYEDSSAAVRETVGEVFLQTDEIGQTENPRLLELVWQSLKSRSTGVLTEIRKEFRDLAHQQLCQRFAVSTWAQIKPCWGRLMEFAESGGDAASFVQPLIRCGLSAARQCDPQLVEELTVAAARFFKDFAPAATVSR